MSNSQNPLTALERVARRIEQRSELSKQTFRKGAEVAHLPD